MCFYEHVAIHIYMFCVYIHIYIDTCTHTVCTSTNIYIYTCIQLYTYIVYTRCILYVGMYALMHIYIYIEYTCVLCMYIHKLQG